MASNFEFYSPTRVIFGKGTEQRVGALVREYGGTRVLIVYGGTTPPSVQLEMPASAREFSARSSTPERTALVPP